MPIQKTLALFVAFSLLIGSPAWSATSQARHESVRARAQGADHAVAYDAAAAQAEGESLELDSELPGEHPALAAALPGLDAKGASYLIKIPSGAALERVSERISRPDAAPAVLDEAFDLRLAAPGAGSDEAGGAPPSGGTGSGGGDDGDGRERQPKNAIPAWLDTTSLSVASAVEKRAIAGSSISIVLRDSQNNTVTLDKPSPALPLRTLSVIDPQTSRAQKRFTATFSPFQMVHQVEELEIDEIRAARFIQLLIDASSRPRPDGVDRIVSSFLNALGGRFAADIPVELKHSMLQQSVAARGVLAQVALGGSRLIVRARNKADLAKLEDLFTQDGDKAKYHGAPADLSVGRPQAVPRYILRFLGSTEAPAADIERIKALPGIVVVDSTPVMLAVEGNKAELESLLAVMSSWRLFPVVEHALPDSKPAVTRTRAAKPSGLEAIRDTLIARLIHPAVAPKGFRALSVTLVNKKGKVYVLVAKKDELAAAKAFVESILSPEDAAFVAYEAAPRRKIMSAAKAAPMGALPPGAEQARIAAIKNYLEPAFTVIDVKLKSDAPSGWAGPMNVASIELDRNVPLYKLADIYAFLRKGLQNGALDPQPAVEAWEFVHRGLVYRDKVPHPGEPVEPEEAKRILDRIPGQHLWHYKTPEGWVPFLGALSFAPIHKTGLKSGLAPGRWVLYSRDRGAEAGRSLDPQDFYLRWEGVVPSAKGPHAPSWKEPAAAAILMPSIGFSDGPRGVPEPHRELLTKALQAEAAGLSGFLGVFGISAAEAPERHLHVRASRELAAGTTVFRVYLQRSASDRGPHLGIFDAVVHGKTGKLTLNPSLYRYHEFLNTHGKRLFGTKGISAVKVDVEREPVHTPHLSVSLDGAEPDWVKLDQKLRAALGELRHFEVRYLQSEQGGEKAPDGARTLGFGARSEKAAGGAAAGEPLVAESLLKSLVKAGLKRKKLVKDIRALLKKGAEEKLRKAGWEELLRGDGLPRTYYMNLEPADGLLFTGQTATFYENGAVELFSRYDNYRQVIRGDERGNISNLGVSSDWDGSEPFGPDGNPLRP